MVNNNWTQTVIINEYILKALKQGDIALLDADGNTFAILVSIDRYRENHK
jgi:hypothetical protein